MFRFLLIALLLALSPLRAQYYGGGGWASAVPVSVLQFNTPEHPVDITGNLDSAAGIQAAIDTLATSGGAVYVPPGSYRIGAAGIRLYSNLQVSGAGDATKLQIAADQSFTHYGVFWGDTVSNVYLHDLWIQGSNASDSPRNLSQKGTYFTTTTGTIYRNVKVQRLHISGLSGEGVYSDGGATMVAPYGIDYVDNTVEHCAGPDAYVHNFTGGGSGHVTGNYANDVIVGYEGPAENSDISFNRFWGIKYYGIWVHNFASTDKVRVQIIGNTIRGVQTGPNAATSVGILVGGWGMLVIGNDVSGFGAPGIAVYPWLRDGGNPQSGVRNVVVANSVHGNGNLATHLAPNFYPAAEIYVAAGATHTLLSDNQVEFETAGTLYGLYNSGTDTTYHSNTFSGGFTNDIIEDGDGTIQWGNRTQDDEPSGQPFSLDGARFYAKRSDGTGITKVLMRPGVTQGTNYLLVLTADGNTVVGGIDQNFNWRGGVGPVTFKDQNNNNIGQINDNNHFMWGGTNDTGPNFNIFVPDTTPGGLTGLFAVTGASNKIVGIGAAANFGYIQGFNGPLVLNGIAGSAPVVLAAPYTVPPDADLLINTCAFYLDEGGNNLKSKCKNSTGAIGIGTLTLQ